MKVFSFYMVMLITYADTSRTGDHRSLVDRFVEGIGGCVSAPVESTLETDSRYISVLSTGQCREVAVKPFGAINPPLDIPYARIRVEYLVNQDIVPMVVLKR